MPSGSDGRILPCQIVTIGSTNMMCGEVLRICNISTYRPERFGWDSCRPSQIPFRVVDYDLILACGRVVRVG